MSKRSSILEDFQAYTERLIDTHNVPAISLALCYNQKLHKAAAGILNVETGIEATTDSIFQIGSITKVMTASLIMQLVDEGKVKLENPVKHYIRDFAIADSEARESITVRQLLNHTNGLAGDFFPDDIHDTGNPIARFVDRCHLLPLVHPVGEYYSYSNAAFAIAGRLIEVVTGGSWFDAMEERLFEPLGMKHSICRPMNVLRHRAAIGHFPDPNISSRWQLTEQSYLSLGQASAGSTPAMTPADLVVFAQAHLTQGIAKNGKEWLSKNAVSQMQQPQIQMPTTSTVLTSHMGLAWKLHRVKSSGRLFIDHMGGTLGQRSIICMVPDQDLSFAVLTNTAKDGVIESIAATLLQAFADIDIDESQPAVVTPTPENLAVFNGAYQSFGDEFIFSVKDSQLTAVHQDTVVKNPAEVLQLRPLNDTTFWGYNRDSAVAAKFQFLNPDSQGVYQRLSANGRILQRINK